MSVTDEARPAAAQAANSKPLEVLARVGLLTYGLTHLVVAWLAWRISRRAGESRVMASWLTGNLAAGVRPDRQRAGPGAPLPGGVGPTERAIG
jgi:hypothetical protein